METETSVRPSVTLGVFALAVFLQHRLLVRVDAPHLYLVIGSCVVKRHPENHRRVPVVHYELVHRFVASAESGLVVFFRNPLCRRVWRLVGCGTVIRTAVLQKIPKRLR